MNTIKVAAVQMNALKDDLDHNLEVHIDFTQKAADAGCSLVLFPELSVSSHYGDPEAVKFAEEADRGRSFSLMSDLAKKHGMFICYGFCEKAHGTHYNSQAVMGPKGMIGVQRKLHASSDEYLVYRMGRSIETFDLGFCRAGLLICYDSAFSEAWRVLALRGVELIMQPNAGRIGKGVELSEKEQLDRLREKRKSPPGQLCTGATENGVFVLNCGQVGYNGHSTHGGGAIAIDPYGEVIERAEPTTSDTFITAELDLEKLEQVRRGKNFVLKCRRPELYGELCAMI